MDKARGMNIIGVTTCVDNRYKELLKQTLPVWIGGLDSLKIVTRPDNVVYYSFNNTDSKIEVIETNAFGEFFNKGAALNIGIAHANPQDWVLSFDCDILPPNNWKNYLTRAKTNCINGGFRYNEEDKNLDNDFFICRGYFQLWNVKDLHYQSKPPFIEWCEHAGRYDTIFANQWPKKNHNNLGIRLVHLGEKSKWWFGNHTTKDQMKKALDDFKIKRNS